MIFLFHIQIFIFHVQAFIGQFSEHIRFLLDLFIENLNSPT